MSVSLEESLVLQGQSVIFPRRYCERKFLALFDELSSCLSKIVIATWTIIMDLVISTSVLLQIDVSWHTFDVIQRTIYNIKILNNVLWR